VKRVFISYSQKDKDIAAKVKAALEGHSIAVTIDSESMAAGSDIREFIDNSIRNTQVTLSIVSKNSLTSDWVALESVESFAAEKFLEGKKFIACYIDEELFRDEFLIEAIDALDQQIKEIENKIQDCAKRNVNAKNFETKKDRKYRLRNSLPDILGRLLGSLTLDIREPEFDKNLQRIIVEINKIPDNDPLPGRPAASLEFRRRLVDALLQCNCMTTPTSRNQIISQLPAEIGTTIPRHENTKADVFSIVTRVNDFKNGLNSLLEVVNFFEGNSAAWNNLQQVIGKID
jgi:hypothetical protein